MVTQVVDAATSATKTCTLLLRPKTVSSPKKPNFPTSTLNTAPNDPESPQQTGRAQSKEPQLKRPATAVVSIRGNSVTQVSSTRNPQHSLNNFKFEKIIGQGAYAVVKLANDKSRGNKVAVKIYEKYNLSDPRRMKNVRREISILQELEHPNIIKMLDSFETPKQVNLIKFIAMI